MTNGNDKAFRDRTVTMTTIHDAERSETVAGDGLTKREYFAAMAMQGLLTAHGSALDYDFVKTHSVRLADIFIEELNK